MGNGYFDGSKLHFVVAALYNFTGTDEADCIDVIQRTSIFLHQATLGQVQFGTIYLADGTLAIADAEVLLDKVNSTSSSTRGDFGHAGAAVSLLNDTRTKPNLIVHEFGHHLWDLGDEYRASFHRVVIDRSITPPDRKTVPIETDSSLDAPVPPGSDFLTVFSGTTERRRVASTTATEIKLDPSDSDLPNLATLADNTRGDLSFRRKCGDPTISHSSFCIMELEAASVSEFCDVTNHNTGELTEQQSFHGESCWDTIVNVPAYAHLIAPPGPAQQPQLDPVNVVRLLAEARFALLLDISGSMQGECPSSEILRH